MKLRHVFSARDAAHARHVVALLQRQGIGSAAISLVARPDIELGSIPNRFKEADTDLVPAALRGMAIGGATGLLIGLVAMAFDASGVSLGGAFAIGAIGVLVGGLSAALMGAALPDPIRQRFDHELAAGRVLVLVDADEQTHARLEQALADAGAVRLTYEAHTALS